MKFTRRLPLFAISSLVFFALFLSVPVTAQAATIRLNDAKVFVNVEPGQHKTGQILLENPTDENVKVRVYAEDWSYQASGSGEKDFFAAGSVPGSASPWITFQPQEFVMEPFSKITVGYNVQVPEGAEVGTHHSVLFYETILGETVNEEGANVLVAARLGSLFYVQVGPESIKGEILGIDVTPPVGNKPAEFKVTFKNTGDTDIILKGNFIIMDTEGIARGRGELNPIYTQPGMEVGMASTWIGKLDPAVYDVLFTFDLGQGHTRVEEKKLVIGSSGQA